MSKRGLKKGQRHEGQFQKGKSGNPGGRPTLSDKKRKIKDACEEFIFQYWEAYERLIKYNKKQLIDVRNNEDYPAVVREIANIILDCMASGTSSLVQVEIVIDRVLGKPKFVQPDFDFSKYFKDADYEKLTDKQLERILAGEDFLKVILSK